MLQMKRNPFVFIILIFLLSGCGFARSYAEGTNTRLVQGKNYLRLGGRVVDPANGRWPNDVLVVVFLLRHGNLEGAEVGRSITKLGEFEVSREGAHDGLFVIELANLYGLFWDKEVVLNQSQRYYVEPDLDTQTYRSQNPI